MMASSTVSTAIASAKLAWTILAAVLAMGIWVGTIQAEVSDKAEKADVQSSQAAMTEILKRIEEKIDDVDDKVEKVDERQRTLSEDVAELKAKVE